jgi:hypothetical protein
VVFSVVYTCTLYHISPVVRCLYTTISHRYLRWLTGGGGHFLALLSKLGVVSCPLSQECVESVSIVPELVCIVSYFITTTVPIKLV